MAGKRERLSEVHAYKHHVVTINDTVCCNTVGISRDNFRWVSPQLTHSDSIYGSRVHRGKVPYHTILRGDMPILPPWTWIQARSLLLLHHTDCLSAVTKCPRHRKPKRGDAKPSLVFIHVIHMGQVGENSTDNVRNRTKGVACILIVGDKVSSQRTLWKFHTAEPSVVEAYLESSKSNKLFAPFFKD